MKKSMGKMPKMPTGMPMQAKREGMMMTNKQMAKMMKGHK